MMLGLLTGVAEAQKQKKKNTIQKQQTVDQTISSYRANKKMHNNVLMPAQTNPTYTLSNISSNKAYSGILDQNNHEYYDHETIDESHWCLEFEPSRFDAGMGC